MGFRFARALSATCGFICGCSASFDFAFFFFLAGDGCAAADVLSLLSVAETLLDSTKFT